MKAFMKSCVVTILTFEAQILLRRTRPTIIAVTGSVGKTATKDALYTVFKQHYRVRKSEKSYNSEIGVPLTVLGLRNAWSNPFAWVKNLIGGFFNALVPAEYPDILILEVGVDKPGDMKRLTRWLKPDYVVLTRLPSVPVHVENFVSPEAVIDEKMLLAAALKPDGVLIYNQDDVVIERQLPQVDHKKIGYGRYTNAPYRISADKTMYQDEKPSGISFVLSTSEATEIFTVNGCVGMQSAYVYTAATAVAHQFNISLEDAASALATHESPVGRMRIIPGVKDSILIDDSYNSSPVAVESALQTLNEITYASRKIAVLGDMLELGQYSIEQHQRMGSLAAGAADILITVGVRAQQIAQGALEAGMPESCIFQYENVDRAGRELQLMLQPNDVVLIKASQSIRAERIVEEVMQEPERASELLARQSAQWKQR